MDYSYFGNKKRRRQLNSQTTRVRNKIALLALRVMLAVALIGGFAVSAIGFGLYRGIILAAPEFDLTVISAGNEASVIICGHTFEELHRLHGGENRTFVTLDYISPHMVNAIVAIEDERFWQHNGIDIRGIGRALHNALTTDGDTQGASTITQQLIKNTFGFFEGELVWKLQEQWMAVQMERELTEIFGCNILAKEYIIEMYLNEINLGRQNYGVQAAAMFYFGVDAIDLTVAQSAVIAAITQNPSRFPPDLHPERNWGRAQDVLNNMLRLGFITEEEHFEAMTTDVYATMIRDGSSMAVVSTMSCYHDALVVQVRDDLMALNGWSAAQALREIYTGGYRIYSVQNLAMQEIVDRHFENEENFPQQDFRIHIEFNLTARETSSGLLQNFSRQYTARTYEELEEFKERVRQEVLEVYDEIVRERPIITLQPQAAFVLIDHHTGHVLAMRGIRGEKQASRVFCRATQATRQPGSQMKPLATFLPAFDLGLLTPSSSIDDVPLVIPQLPPNEDHRVRNWYRNPPYEGLTNPRRAIYHSGNITSTRALMDYVGLNTMWEYLHRLGLTTLVDGEWRNGRWMTDRNYVTTLGALTDGVRLIEFAAAYAAIANGGLYNRPILYSRVVDRNGNVILENHHEPRRVMRDTTAYLLIDTMKDTVVSGTGTAMNWIANPQMRADIPVAGKTGTTDDSRDLGFSGFTPYLTASLWFGNDDNLNMSTQMRNGMARASAYLGPLWRNIMQEIHEGFAPRQYDRPHGITEHRICIDSGHLATDLCRTDPRGNRERLEIFAPGTVPTETCAVHQQFLVCTDNHNHLAGNNCTNTVYHIGLVRPIPIPEEFDSMVIRDRQYEHHPSVRTSETCTVCAGGMSDEWWWDWWDQFNNPWGLPQTPDWWDDDDDGDPVYDVPIPLPPPNDGSDDD
ncbi:MAG: transglycosylase domain-containing protein [Defluviitaleaceae bacterium]|nr:transglycosylase domain-containing protein [Defluviitaleaceae bacterium]